MSLLKSKTGSKPTLTWFFQADFADGTTYHQGRDDESIMGLRSAYADVQARIDEVESFSLTDGLDKITLDLQDGKFTKDGLSFYLHNTDLPLDDPQLVYERKTPVEVTVEIRSGKEVGPRKHYVKEYLMGFEDRGKKYVIAIEGTS